MGMLALYGILVVVMLVGVVGAVVPGLPGPSLILAAILVWCFAIGLGSVIGNLIEMVLAIVAVGIFLWNTWPAMLWG